MRNATVSQPVPVSPVGNWLRYGIAVAVVAIAAALAVEALDTAPPSPAAVVSGQTDPHESPEIMRVPSVGIDPHESPEIMRAR